MDVRSPRDGRVIEELGYYDPTNAEPQKQIVVNRERVEHWLRQGAMTSPTVRQLLRRQGIAAR
jgi:small subunit ribosomal protein S16